MKIKKDFTQIPNKLLNPSKLSAMARLLACVIIKYMRKNDFCFPRQELLALDLGCSDRYIRKLISSLIEVGYLRKVRTGFNKSNTYLLGPELEWLYSSDDTGTTVPNQYGTDGPTNNTHRRILNKNNIEVINRIKEKTANKLAFK